MKLTKEEIDETEKIQVNYPENGLPETNWLHCKHCLSEFMNSPQHEVMSPRDYCSYEVSSYPFKYPNGVNANILVVWCKRCHRQVWDSRHLTSLY